jgi:hypothetical protein
MECLVNLGLFFCMSGNVRYHSRLPKHENKAESEVPLLGEVLVPLSLVKYLCSGAGGKAEHGGGVPTQVQDAEHHL